MLLMLKEYSKSHSNCKIWLGLGSINGIKVEMKMHHIQVGPILRRLSSWGVSFPEN